MAIPAMALLVKVYSVSRHLITLFVVGLVPFTGLTIPMVEGKSKRVVGAQPLMFWRVIDIIAKARLIPMTHTSIGAIVLSSC